MARAYIIENRCRYAGWQQCQVQSAAIAIPKFLNSYRGTVMGNEFSGQTVAILKELDHAALSACLYAACDLALRAARGQMPTPPDTMTPDQLVRQLVTEMPDNFKTPATPA
jgi:hypothetical protein